MADAAYPQHALSSDDPGKDRALASLDEEWVKLQNYYTPEELEQAIAAWVSYYDNQRFHESLNNVTLTDVYFGREKEIIEKRNELKEQTLALRHQQYYQWWVYNQFKWRKSPLRNVQNL